MAANVIDLEEKKEVKQLSNDLTVKKALLIAKMHALMNEAELEKSQLYDYFAKAFYEGGDPNEVQTLINKISEQAGRAFAYKRCAEMLAEA